MMPGQKENKDEVMVYITNATSKSLWYTSFIYLFIGKKVLSFSYIS